MILERRDIMNTITLKIENAKDAEMILNLAKRLNCEIITSPTKTKKNSEEIISIMKSISKRGTLAKAIPDPVKWQRKIRKDKPLLGR